MVVVWSQRCQRRRSVAGAVPRKRKSCCSAGCRMVRKLRLTAPHRDVALPDYFQNVLCACDLINLFVVADKQRLYC